MEKYPMVICVSSEKCSFKMKGEPVECGKQEPRDCKYAVCRGTAGGCECCGGDMALFWRDKENNAFIDSKGEILVTVRGQEMFFKVHRCPNCGYVFPKQVQNEK